MPTLMCRLIGCRSWFAHRWTWPHRICCYRYGRA